MKCRKCNKEIRLIEFIMYWGYCFIHRLEKNGEVTLK